MDVRRLKEKLTNKLNQTFINDEIQTDFGVGLFIVTRKQYTIRIVIRNEELSYSFKLNRPINNLVIGFGREYEILPHASKSEMEDLYRCIQEDIYSLLRNIATDEIYAGYDDKAVYIAYEQGARASYLLRKFKKIIIFGVSVEEKPVDESVVKGLGLKPLSSFEKER